MFTIPNQSSLPKAYTQFTAAEEPKDIASYIDAEGGSRLMPSGNRDRLVDCMEEFVKYTVIMRQHIDLFNDRYSERAAQEPTPLTDSTMQGETEKAGQEGNAKTITRAGLVNGVDVSGI